MQINAWYRANQYKDLRYDYKLDADSVVFDLGGFEGEWSSKISQKYNPWIYVFEPHPLYYAKLVDTFSSNNKIKVFPFGLAGHSGKIYLSDDLNASSIVKNSKPGIPIDVIDISDFLNQNQFSKIDLIKINSKFK